MPNSAKPHPAPREVVWLEYADFREKALAGDSGAYGVMRADPRCTFLKMADPTMMTGAMEGIDPSYVMQFIISTDAVDREMDEISASGWDWSNYFAGSEGQTAGPVLWCHDRSPESLHGILGAKCPPAIQTINGAQIATCIFPTPEQAGFEPDQPHLAKSVRAMYQAGFFKSTSVGMMPLEYSLKTGGGIIFTEKEGLEWSLVPVPANPGCYQLAASKGISLAPIGAWAEKALDEIHGRPGLYVTRKKLERVLRSCGLSPDVSFFLLTENQMADKLKKTVTVKVNAARVKDAEPAEPEADAVAVAESTVERLDELADAVKELRETVAKALPLIKASAPDPLVELKAARAAIDAKILALGGEVATEKKAAEPAPADFRTEMADMFRAALNEHTPQTGKVY